MKNSAEINLNEDWRTIPNYENYLINQFGKVKSLQRFTNSRNGSLRIVKERYLKPTLNGRGYLTLSMYNSNGLKRFHVHQIVCMAFYNHTVYGMGITVDHIDENKLNNNFENLQLISHRENVIKSIDKSKTTSQYTGVCYDKSRKKWRVMIKINGKNIFLGRFKNEIEASVAYKNKTQERMLFI